MKTRQAVFASLGLSVLFLAVYGGTNWLTSLRTDVGILYFGWEKHIPFVPWMIIPYMSIDVFFVAAPFVCRSREELNTLVRRIGFAILVAAACFLIFPLRFAFDHPPVTGWLGVLYREFRGFDRPYNLLPSLHIALGTILVAHYSQHSRAWLRALLWPWFGLIFLSTLLIYQHHVIDVIGGFVLAVWCFYLFRETPIGLPVQSNWKVGSYYGVGAILFAAVGLLFGLWGFLFLWPAASLAVVAVAYFGIGPGIYRKTADRIPFSARALLWPCLIGQRLSLAWYRRQCRAWDEVTTGVWIGNKLSDAGAEEAIRQGVTAVLDLTAEFDEAKPFLALPYLNLPILDLTAPSPEQMAEMANFIRRHAASGILYVHCKAGYSRSAAAVGAYLLTHEPGATVKDVLRCMRDSRPSIVIRTEIDSVLSRFHQSLQCASSCAQDGPVGAHSQTSPRFIPRRKLASSSC
jgi:membrane-associated phospholipid phosphatase